MMKVIRKFLYMAWELFLERVLGVYSPSKVFYSDKPRYVRRRTEMLVQYALMVQKRDAIRNKLAAIHHGIMMERTSRLLSICIANNDGSMTIPAEAVSILQQRAATPYEELTEDEREAAGDGGEE